MNKQVDFYILTSNDEASILQTVCRLAEKILSKGLRIFILTNDPSQTQTLDQLLWTFSAASFVPHSIADAENQKDPAELVLLHHQPQDLGFDVLINLQTEAATTQNYTRMVEIVNQNEAIRANSREKFRAYKSHEFTIKTHELTA